MISSLPSDQSEAVTEIWNLPPAHTFYRSMGTSCDLVSCGILKEDTIKVRGQRCFGGDAGLVQSKYSSLELPLVHRD